MAIIDAAKIFTKELPREKKEPLHLKHSAYFRGWEPADYTYVNLGDLEDEDAAPETNTKLIWTRPAEMASTAS
jgi:hypothetical protein